MTNEPAGHQHDSQQHRLLAALKVGVAAQQEPTERAEEEGEGVGGKCDDERQRLVLRREDLGGEVDREGGVDVQSYHSTALPTLAATRVRIGSLCGASAPSWLVDVPGSASASVS